MRGAKLQINHDALAQVSVEMEEHVIAWTILRPEMFPEISITAEAFSDSMLRRFWQSMLDCWEDGNRFFDAVAVIHKMVEVGHFPREAKPGEASDGYVEHSARMAEVLSHYLIRPASISSKAINFYAEKLMHRKRRTQLAYVKGMTSESLSNDAADVDDILRVESDEVAGIGNLYDIRQGLSLETLADECVEDEKVTERIKLGYPDLDKICGSMGTGKVLTVYGRTSVGKTYLATNFMTSMLRDEKRRFSVFFASLEMEKGDVFDRLTRALYHLTKEEYTNETRRTFAAAMAPHLSVLLKNPASFHDIAVAQKKFENSYAMFPVRVVVVDHLQYMAPIPGRSTYESTSTLAKQAKEYAKTQNVMVILLSQIKRAGPSQTAPLEIKPTLSDGRDSGAIEESADVILGVRRDEEVPNKFIIETLKVREGAPPNQTVELLMDWETGVLTPAGWRG